MVQSGFMKALTKRLGHLLGNGAIMFLVVVTSGLALSGSVVAPAETTRAKARAYTRNIEFNFVGWMFDSLVRKFADNALAGHQYLTAEGRRQAVFDYMILVQRIQSGESQLRQIYADPNVSDPIAASQKLQKQLEQLYKARDSGSRLAEGVLESQINTIVSELGLTPGGQAVPPVLYHSTPLPLALIISPRDAIRQDADISLLPNVTVDRQVKLEDQVDRALNVSSLVVEIGGVGVYPTMVAQTSNLEWLSEVVSHEWIHNYLTLRPLGINYLSSPELRIMNETTANIAGKEIGRMVLERYYPELVPPPAPPDPPDPPSSDDGAEAPAVETPPPFSFNAQMHITRVRVDELLAEGKIEEAEAYMEARRKVFWENGYTWLRKINQAYFAFHGAYADEPQGAAGEDPVGAAVRELRRQSPSLTAFVQQMAWMNSWEDLQAAIKLQSQQEPSQTGAWE